VFSEHGLARWASLPAGADTAARVAALARAWSSMPAGAVACAVTCGELGSWWLARDGAFHVPAPSIDAVDTLGAGDVFHGAYALALAEGRDVRAAAHFATIAAAIKCTRDGGRAGCPTRDEVDAFAQK
jgi:sulfofructose kinase